MLGVRTNGLAMGLALATAGALACTRTNPSFGEEAGASGSGETGGTTNDPSVASAESATTKSTTSSDTAVDTTVSEGEATSDVTGETTRGDPDTTDTVDPATEGTDATSEGGVAECANGILERGEECDFGVGFLSCQDLGFGPGDVVCTDMCKLSIHCCGDGDVDRNELCEPNTRIACEDYGFSVNLSLPCTAFCELVGTGCPACGDGVRQEEVEDCDFEGEHTCAEHGLEVVPGDNADVLICEECAYSGGCCIPEGAPCSHGEAVECCSGNCSNEICQPG